MPLFFNGGLLLPINAAPPKLSNHLGIELPCFKVESKPDALLLSENLPNTLKYMALMRKPGIRSFKPLVIFFDFLRLDKNHLSAGFLAEW